MTAHYCKTADFPVKEALWGVDKYKDANNSATDAGDFPVKVRATLGGEDELTLQHKHFIQKVNFSNGGAALATASKDEVLRNCDLEQPSESNVKFEGNVSGVKQVLCIDRKLAC